MRKCCLLAFIAINSITLFAQTRIGESRQMKAPIPLEEYNQTTHAVVNIANSTQPSTQTPPTNSRFTIVGQDGNYFILSFWVYPSSNPNYQTLNFYAGGSSRIYFRVPKENIDDISNKLYKRVSPIFGTMTLPFKYRPQNGKFEKTFSLNAVGGVRLDPARLNTFTLSVMVGVGASSATLTKKNTDPSSNITDPKDQAAVTLSFNTLIQWERLQFGLSIGIDNLLDNETVKWKQQAKPWLSFGIGFAIFSDNEVKVQGTN